MTWIVCKATTGEDGLTRVIASTPTEDRYGDIVSAPWQLDRYRQNPVVVFAHDYNRPVVGRAVDVRLEGENLVAVIEWDDHPSNPLGQTIAHQFRSGFLSAVSVGFQPGIAVRRSQLDQQDPRHGERGNVFTDNELLEISAVPIPANPEALAKRSQSPWMRRHILEVEETEEGVRVLYAKAPREEEEIEEAKEHKEDEDEYKGVKTAAYESIDFTPPKGCVEEARRGVEWLEEGYGGDGLTAETKRWARKIANGDDITPDKARKMAAWLARHAVDKEAEGFKPGEDGYPSAGRVAWALWCGDAGVSWSRRLVRQMDAEDEREGEKSLRDNLLDLIRSDHSIQAAIEALHLSLIHI